MKKFILVIATLFIFLLSSCSKGDRSHNYDAMPYEEYKTFTINDNRYAILVPEDINTMLDYTYYDLNITSNKEEWLVNAYVDLEYKASNNQEMSKELLDIFYDFAINDNLLDSLSFTQDIKESNSYEIEKVIENTNKEEIGCGVFIIYLTLLIKENNDSFYLSIPINENILITKDDYITDPFTNEYITKESFSKKYI